MPSSIVLPDERVLQLRQIASARSVTVVSLIEDLIAREIAAGTISDELPGITVKPMPDVPGVMIWFNGTGGSLGHGFGLGAIHPRIAAAFAESIESVLDGKASAMRLVIDPATKSYVAKVSQNAIAIAFEDSTGENSGKRSLSLGMARDLVKLINRVTGVLRDEMVGVDWT